MSKNDIFNEYAKIALEKGLIKKAEESKELKKYKEDSYPRAGSDTLEVIESLYGVKPNKPKGQEYKQNIMEVAHPDKVILDSSYDKINALIENNIERQKIIINITQKPVNGQHTQHKYATVNLAKSLLQIANDMGNRNIEPLRKLADTCIQQLQKEALSLDDIKDWISGKGSDVVDVGEGAATGAGLGAIVGGLIGAFGGPPGIVAGAATGAIAGGLLSAIFKTGPQAQSVKINAIEAQGALSKLMASLQNDLFLTSLNKALDSITRTSDEYSILLDQAHASAEADPALQNRVTQIAIKYQNEIIQLDRIIDIFIANANSGRYDKEEGDWLSKLEKPIDWIFGTKVTDTVNAMKSLEIATHKALQGITEARQQAVSLKSEIPQVQQPVQRQNTSNIPEFSADYLSQLEKSLSPSEE